MTFQCFVFVDMKCLEFYLFQMNIYDNFTEDHIKMNTDVFCSVFQKECLFIHLSFPSRFGFIVCRPDGLNRRLYEQMELPVSQL